MAKDKRLYVTPREDGRFNVLRPNAQRASAVTDTQAQAIARAKALEPSAKPHVQRVRDIGPGPDKFRQG